MSRKTRKLIWSAPLVAVFAVIGALALFMTLTPNETAAQELLPDPGQPMDLVATKDGQNTIDLLWEAPEDGAEPDGYRIDMSSDGLIWMQLEADTDSEATNYTHDGLSAGTQMYYRVFGLNRDAVGKVSNYANATTDPAVAPDQPTNLAVTVAAAAPANATTIHLCWTQPDEDGGASISDWVIETSMDGGQRYRWTALDLSVSEVDADNPTDGTPTCTATHTHAATHDGLLATQRWVYQVKAVNTAGTSEPSLTDDASTADAPDPEAPTGLIASMAYNSNEVRLHWYAPADPAGADIDGYLIEGVDGASFTGTEPTDDTTLLKLTDSSNFLDTSTTGADHGQERTYRVWAVSSTDEMTASSTITVTIPPAAVQGTEPDTDYVSDMPTNLKANADGRTSITLTWERPDNMGTTALNYRVDVSDNDGLEWELLEIITDQGADTDTNPTYTHDETTEPILLLLAGETRYYRVFASDTTFAVGEGGVAGEGVSKSSGPHPAKASATTARAVDPDEPRNLEATEDGQTVINLCWTQPFPTENTGDTNLIMSNAGHKVEASMDGGASDPWEVLDIKISTSAAALTAAGCDTDGANTAVPADDGNPMHTHTATHEMLDPGARWVYQVKAVNSAGDSPPSLTDDATTAPATVPSIPVGVTAENRGPRAIALLWNTPLDPGGAEVTGYKIEVSSDKGKTWSTRMEDTGSTTTSYDHTGLMAESTWTYRVSAINAVGAGQS